MRRKERHAYGDDLSVEVKGKCIANGADVRIALRRGR